MLRSNVKRKTPGAEPVVSIYLQMLKEYLSCEEFTPEFEQEVKQAVKRAGGQVNCSGLFLSTTSQALDVKSKPVYSRNKHKIV